MVTVEQIKHYIDGLAINQLIDVKVPLVTDEGVATKNRYRTLKAYVKRIYPHIISTNRGCFMHKDIYFWNVSKNR